jgi:hypothetical protein
MAKKFRPIRSLYPRSLALVIVILLVSCFGVALTLTTGAATYVAVSEAENGTLTTQATPVNDAAASGGKAVRFTAQTGGSQCTISAKLVNSCRPWLGAFANTNPSFASDIKSQILGHESLIGRQLDMPHTYHPAGSNTLSSTDIYFANRPNTILVTNWKPANDWGDAGGGNASVNAGIDQMANSIKSLGSKKIMLVLFHEPENDVSNEPSCPNISYKGNLGTPTEYRNMWANVQNRFDALGVTNVVWVMNYMGFSNWNCLIKPLWPGNDRVDWVAWDPYSPSNDKTWDEAVSEYYNYFANNSDSSHAFTSKPWMLGEFGIGHGSSGGRADQPHTYAFYDDAKASLAANRYPRLKAYLGFDTQGVHDTQIAYVTVTHEYDPVELQHYKAFAQDPRFTDSYYIN